MNTENWEKIETIFHRARHLPPDAREEYYTQACGDDLSLRAEVESLIASLESESEFLEEPAFDLGMKVLGQRLDVSLTGQSIGTYRIHEKLGSGGMGDVYLAEDVRLERKVALKFLSASLVDDGRAKRQLFREAQALMRIDHPNICPVYDVKEIGEHSFIVMKYIEGVTLSELIKNRRIEEKQFVEIARQIADALQAAHESGIIHRDIKAGNIMVTPNGRVKVLDFGLAKIVSNQKTDGNGDPASLMTQTNAIVGTIAYMSPEQLRAEKLDFRTDIFSLGTVYYELTTGRNPFLQPSDAETIAAILHDPFKPVAGLKNGNAAAFNRVIKKCLEKDKEKRYQSVAELLTEFQSFQNEKPAGFKSSVFKRWLATAILILVILTVGVFVYRRAVAPRSLAVLPFLNLSANTENDFIGGMAETLIQKIAGSSDIEVHPFTQVANYKLNSVNPVEIGQALKVDAVLTGRVIEQNDQLILETSLINVADGSRLWTENNAFKESDALVVQNNISQKIISKLQSSLTVKASETKSAPATDNPEAYKYYLQGLNYWKQRDRENIKKAIDAFNQAISIDPNYALAYTGLAYCYIARASVNYRAMPPLEAITIAQAKAEKAVALDENLSEPHTALGAIMHKYYWNWNAAEAEYQKALRLNPNSAQNYYWYSEMLVASSRFEEALAASLKAKELDPFTPSMDVNVGRILYYWRRFDESEKYLTEALRKNPNNSGAKAILGFVYLQQPSAEKQTAALKIFEELYASDKKSYAASLGYAYGKLGKKTEALQILQDFEKEEAAGEYFPIHEKAMIYLGLEDDENALLMLEKAHQNHFLGLNVLNVSPIYDSLRSSEKMQNLLIRMNLNNRF